MVMIFGRELVFSLHCLFIILKNTMELMIFQANNPESDSCYLVIRRLSRKLGEPRLRGMDGDLEERL